MPTRYEGFLQEPLQSRQKEKITGRDVAFITADGKGEKTELFLAFRFGTPCEILRIESGKDPATMKALLEKLFFVTFPHGERIKVAENVKSTLRGASPTVKEDEGGVYVENPLHRRKRLVEIGTLSHGPFNRITDVEGVTVGHATLRDETTNTGVTAVHPHQGNVFKEKCEAGHAVFNGFGKSMGLVQLEETGTIETPVVFTNTLSAGTAFAAVAAHTVAKNPLVGRKLPTVNPLVLECNDGSLSDIQAQAVQESHVHEALRTAGKDFRQGSVGAGSGMTTHGFKGGIGSSSRIVEIGDKTYTLGVLLNANFHGNTARHLVFKGRHLGRDIGSAAEQEEDQGSITILVATDAPLCSRQLKRIARRSFFGIARTGSIVSGGSGDLAVAFSIANRRDHFEETVVHDFQRLSERKLDPFFQAVIEATEEAILHAMLHSPSTEGFRGKKKASLWDHVDSFEDLLIPLDD